MSFLMPKTEEDSLERNFVLINDEGGQVTRPNTRKETERTGRKMIGPFAGGYDRLLLCQLIPVATIESPMNDRAIVTEFDKS